jgi:hypothetical protein
MIKTARNPTAAHSNLQAPRSAGLIGRIDEMHGWCKTCGVWALSLAARLRDPTIVIVTIILLAPTALSQSDSDRLGMSANQLARKVVTHELKVQDENHDHWMYRLEKDDSARKQVQEIIETNNGSLSRLLSMGGRPLDAKQQQKRIFACRAS